MHFEHLIEGTGFIHYFKNSVIVAIGTMIICVFASSLAAFSLTRFRIKGRMRIAQLTLVLYFFPPIMLIIPLFLLFNQLNLNNTLYGLILGHTTYALPFSLWFLWGFFKSIPLELEEAAMIDGTSRLGAFRHVTLPLAIPAIVAIGIFSFVVSWNDYLFAYTLISGEVNKTLPLVVYAYGGSEAVEWGLLQAACVLLALPPAIGFSFVQKYLVSGLGTFGLKR